MDEGILRISGAQEPSPDKYVSLATVKFLGGLQTQRSSFASIDTRYNSKFLGGKPDALIAGSNVEISNKLTLQRRPGVVPYGISNIPSPTNFFSWELTTTADLILVVDTETAGGDNSAGMNGAVFNYSPTSSGIYFNKANLSKQTNFISVANTMYMGDGVDLLKVIGPNLLRQSNNFGSGSGTIFTVQSPWIDQNVFSLASGAADPVGGTDAVQLVWGTTGSSAYLEQDVVPNYTPIPNNTFTFSIWLRELGTPLSDIDLQIRDQSGLIATKTVSLTQGWAQYYVTGTMNNSSNTVNVRLTNPTTTNPIVIYGAQLEVGGPATTTQITTNLPQGVYLWGIQAPGTAPNISVSASVVGTPWQPNHLYTTAILALTSVANASAGSTVYTGKIVNGAGNFFAGYKFTVAGFFNTPNNGVFACTASSGTTLTLSNANGVLETNPGTATPTFSITSVVAGNRSATYFGTILGGVAIGYAGYALTIQGFSNPGNNGTFFCTASNNTSITLLNINAINETITASALLLGQAVTDSNGNLEVATASGTSGSTAPAWSAGIGGQTPDGLQNIFIVQTASNSTSSSSAAVTLPNNVKLGNSLLAFMVVNRNASTPSVATDSQSNTYTPIAGITSGPFSIYLSWAQNVAAGMTTITATCSGAGDVWVGVVESSPLNNLDVEASNQANSVPSGSGVFQTGLVSTAQIDDLLISFSCVIAGNQSTSSSSPPPNFIEMLNATGINLSQGRGTINVAFEFLTTTQSINPQWTVTFGAGGSRELGVTAAFNAASTTTLVWTNYGAIALTAIIGFTYYYAFMNSETGHVSNVSPLSGSTGPIGGQSVTITGVGMQTTPSGPYGQDPQVDTIALFRNTDGGGFWYQVATFPNPGTSSGAGTWSYVDVTPSSRLNTSIFAPIGLLNSLPPVGLVNMEYFEGRLFGSVKNLLYYNTAADNATLLGVTQNGVAAESWIGDNVIPFNAPIVRSVAVGGGLIVCTTLDTWFVTGINILQGGFNPQKALAKHGVRFYNAVDLDGSNVYVYTSDREFLIVNPNSGSVEMGYPIGDTLEDSFSPLSAYVARHVSGSRDNAVFLADGDTGWYRLNPNQVGASMAGEATPVWSPKADFTQSINGIGAIASIETSPGNIQLLIGQTAQGTPTGSHPVTVGISQQNQGRAASPGLTSLTVPFLSDNTAHSLLVAFAYVGTGPFATVVDTQGNIWIPVPDYIVDPPNPHWDSALALFYCADCKAGPNIVTLDTPSTALIQLQIYEVKGYAAGTIVLAASGHDSTTSPTPNCSTTNDDGSPADVPSGAYAMGFGWTDNAFGIPGSGYPFTAGPGFTSRQQQTDLTFGYSTFTQDGFASGGGPLEASYGIPGDTSWGCYVIAFQGTPTYTGGAPILVRDLITFSDNGVPYNWTATIGSILLTTPGKLAEVDSITTEMNNAGQGTTASQCTVAVLLDEIAGVPESLPMAVNDPPGEIPSVSVLSNRFYLSQGDDCPVCRHIQIQLTGETVSGLPQTSKDEILALTVRGALVSEQT